MWEKRLNGDGKARKCGQCGKQIPLNSRYYGSRLNEACSITCGHEIDKNLSVLPSKQTKQSKERS